MVEPVAFPEVMEQALRGVRSAEVQLFYEYFDELKRQVRSRTHRSVVNQIHHDHATTGERLADHIASGIGSCFASVGCTMRSNRRAR